MMKSLRNAAVATSALLVACEQEQPNPTDPIEYAPILQTIENGRGLLKHAFKTGEIVEGDMVSAALDEQMSNLQKKLEARYGVQIFMDEPDLDYLYGVWSEGERDVEHASDDVYPKIYKIPRAKQLNVLKHLEERLALFPPLIVKRYGPKRLHLIGNKPLEDNNWNYINILRDHTSPEGDDILLVFTQEGEKLDDNFVHELFHAADAHDGGWESGFEAWMKYTHVLDRDKLYPDRARTANCFGDYDNFPLRLRDEKGCRSLLTRELKGYLHTYGMVFVNPEEPSDRETHTENKATEAGILFELNQNEELGIDWFVERAHEDPNIAKRLALLTGCKFRLYKYDGMPYIEFTRLLTEEEYSHLTGGTVEGFDYYRKWSTDAEGRVWMDHHYYNDLFRRNVIDEGYWERKIPSHS